MRRIYQIAIAISLVIIAMQIPSLVHQQEHSNWIDLAKDRRYTGFLWNLLFAWVAVVLGQKAKGNIWFILWLIWLPNTLYLITDLKYFMSHSDSQLCFHIPFFSLYTIAGILTYVVAILPRWSAQQYSKKWLAIITVVAVLGVGAGRYFRWNSWDVFMRPHAMITDVMSAFSDNQQKQKSNNQLVIEGKEIILKEGFYFKGTTDNTLIIKAY